MRPSSFQPTVDRLRPFKAFFPVGFLTWIAENHQIFVEFSEVADELWDRGVRKNSINMIREVVRFKRVMANKPIVHFTNTMSPYLGRAYVIVHPERVRLFEYVKDSEAFIQAVQSIA